MYTKAKKGTPFGRNLPVEAILTKHSLSGGGAVVECIQFSYLLSQSVQANLDLLRSGYFSKELKFSSKMIVHENFNLMVCVSERIPSFVSKSVRVIHFKINFKIIFYILSKSAANMTTYLQRFQNG